MDTKQREALIKQIAATAEGRLQQDSPEQKVLQQQQQQQCEPGPSPQTGGKTKHDILYQGNVMPE